MSNKFFIPPHTVHWYDALAGEEGCKGCYAISPNGEIVVRTIFLSGGPSLETIIAVQPNRQEYLPLQGTGSIELVGALAVHPHKPLIAVSGFRAVRFWDSETYQERVDLRTEYIKKYINDILFSPDGRLLAMMIGNTGDFGVWHMEEKRWVLQQRITEREKMVYAMAFDPSGAWMAIGSLDEHLRTVNPITGEIIWNVIAGCAVRSVDISNPDEYILIGGDDHTIQLWSVENGERIQRFFGHKATVTSVCFLPHWPNMFASASGKGDMMIWHLEKEEPVMVFPAMESSYAPLRLSRDGKTLLTNICTITTLI